MLRCFKIHLSLQCLYVCLPVPWKASHSTEMHYEVFYPSHLSARGFTVHGVSQPVPATDCCFRRYGGSEQWKGDGQLLLAFLRQPCVFDPSWLIFYVYLFRQYGMRLGFSGDQPLPFHNRTCTRVHFVDLPKDKARADHVHIHTPWHIPLVLSVQGSFSGL